MNKELETKVNGYLANLGVMYFKLHNLHWNVYGLNFKPVHEYLEALYDSITESLDEAAEYLRKNDVLPVANTKDFLAITTIQELSSKEISSKDALDIVYADYNLLKNQASEIRKLANVEDDFLLVSFMEAELSSYAKTLWFLKEMSK